MVSDTDHGKLCSCIGYAIRKAATLKVPSDVETHLKAAMNMLRQARNDCRQQLQEQLQDFSYEPLRSSGTLNAHSTTTLNLAELLFPPDEEPEQAQGDKRRIPRHVTRDDSTAGGSNIREPAMLRRLSEAAIVSDTDVMDTAEPNQQEQTNHELRSGSPCKPNACPCPSLRDDPEGFVRHFVAQATSDAEVVNWLQVMLSDLQREHKEASCGERRSWCIRLCLILRQEIRKHGGKVSSRPVVSQ